MSSRTIYRLLGLLVLFALVFSAVTPALAQPAAAGPGDPQEVAAFMDGLMTAQMSDHHVPGAVVVLVKDGQVLFSKGYGYADLAARTPVNPAATLFRPGSVSKLFVWTAVMQLVEQGKLNLDADVNTYLDFTIPATYPQPITLKTLMTHTPGFEDVGQGLFLLKAEKLPSLEVYLKQTLPARVFAPGKVGAYSNYGTALAGYIVERSAGLLFYEYVEKNIFAPLGMTHATFRQPLPAQLAPDMSGGYNFAGGEYFKGSFEYVSGYPAGGLSASGLDMAKFMIAHLQNGRYGDAQILKEATARQMHTRLYAADPRLDGMAYGFFDNIINGQPVISHGGDTILFHSGLFLLPEQNVGLFISTNAAGGAAMSAAVERAFLQRYFPAAPAPAPLPAADFDSRAAQYAGQYTLARSNVTSFEKFLVLTSPITVSVNDQKQVLMTRSGETTHFVEVEPGLLVDVNAPDNRLVLKVDNGQVTLSPAAPFVMIKAPWQAATALHLLIFGGGALLFGLALLSWFGSALTGLFKPRPQPLAAHLARWVGALFGLTYLAFMGLLLAALLDTNPAFGVPNLFFETPAWFGVMLLFPLAAAAFGVLMVPCALLAWGKRCWNVGDRLFYTLLTVSALAILWALVYWNFLRLP